MSEPNEDDEATKKAIEGLGSTLTNSSSYEASVIQSATLNLAPPLTGTGFPDLRSLAPTFDENHVERNQNLSHDFPHFKRVLQSHQSKLREVNSKGGVEAESTETNIRRIKVQMLIDFLKRHAKLSEKDLGIDMKAERLEEKKRSAYLISNSEGSKQRAQVKELKIVQKKKSKKSFRCLTKSERLESIKEGHMHLENMKPKKINSTLSFGKQILLERNRNLEICSEKMNVDVKQNKHDVDEKRNNGTVVENDDNLMNIVNKRRLREERKKRLLSGKQEGVTEDENNGNQMSKIDSDSPRQIATTTEFIQRSDNNCATLLNSNGKNQSCNEQTNDKDKSKDQLSINTKNSSSFVCPLCQRSFKVNKHKDVDTYMSNHMDRCQRSKKRNQSKVINYVDEENNSNSSEERSKSGDNTFEECDNDSDNDSNSTGDKKIVQKKRIKRMLPLRRSKNKMKEDEVKTTSLDDYEVEEYSDRIEEWIDNFSSTFRPMFESDEELPGMVVYDGGLVVPSWIQNCLFSYQRTGLRWMWELHCQEAGGIVGDEMGLGKTVQICALLQSMIISRKIKSVLLVAPTTLLVHWLQELAKWAPGLRRIVIHKVGEEADGFVRNISTSLLKKLEQWISLARSNYLNEPINDEDVEEEEKTMNEHFSYCGSGYIMITTYENVRRFSDVWTSHNWDYVILDEGQKIRNPNADVTLNCKRFKTCHRLLLSGTPIQNDLRELWSLFDFVFPGRLGTLPTFEQEFADPIKKGGYSNASPMQVQLAYRRALVLRDLINPYLLRRQKRDVKEVSRMPGKTEQVLFCRLSNKQRFMYKTFLKSDEVARIIHGSERSFRAITILRKICNHPSLIQDNDGSFFKAVQRDYEHESLSSEDEIDININDPYLVEDSGKLEVLAKILPLWFSQGHRVLLFCQWKKMLNIVQQFVLRNEWNFCRMDGDTAAGSRQKMVDDFNKDKSKFIMLMTTKTGGVGLNLTGADRIILYDPDWNPQTDAQARERCWRFGQKRSVTIYRLITAGTIEEKIYHRQIFKTAMSNQILQDPKQRRLFTKKDLKDLFTLQEDIDSLNSGGAGCTETARITEGKGVINPETLGSTQKNEDHAKENDEDNRNALGAILRTRGLAGIFEHDSFHNKGKRSHSGTIIEKEMEEQALKAAEQSAKKLQESVASDPKNQFVSTWTGSKETQPRLFGNTKNNNSKKRVPSQKKNSREAENVKLSSFQNEFGSSNIVGMTKSSSLIGKDSKTILESLRCKNNFISKLTP